MSLIAFTIHLQKFGPMPATFSSRSSSLKFGPMPAWARYDRPSRENPVKFCRFRNPSDFALFRLAWPRDTNPRPPPLEALQRPISYPLGVLGGHLQSVKPVNKNPRSFAGFSRQESLTFSEVVGDWRFELFRSRINDQTRRRNQVPMWRVFMAYKMGTRARNEVVDRLARDVAMAAQGIGVTLPWCASQIIAETRPDPVDNFSHVRTIHDAPNPCGSDARARRDRLKRSV